MDSDPDLEIIEKDSGMSSLGGSKDETPERKAVIVCFKIAYSLMLSIKLYFLNIHIYIHGIVCTLGGCC